MSISRALLCQRAEGRAVPAFGSSGAGAGRSERPTFEREALACQQVQYALLARQVRRPDRHDDAASFGRGGQDHLHPGAVAADQQLAAANAAV